MKLHRIHVENFKAIDERTLELPDCGVVIATGRNEIGKTSMVEALDLLLDTSTKASSKSRKVRIAQPYGTSLQVVVEAEMTIGDHRFVHRKCFLKDKESSLKFLAGPRAGQTITGDEAVEMMETLLSGTDMTLWNALRLMQASGLSPLRLDSSQALTAALEQAGGQQPDEGSGGGLMDRARAEYDKYFTPGDQSVATSSQIATSSRRSAATLLKDKRGSQRSTKSSTPSAESTNKSATIRPWWHPKRPTARKLRLPLRASLNSRRRSRPPNVLPRKQRSVMPRPRGPTT